MNPTLPFLYWGWPKFTRTFPFIEIKHTILKTRTIPTFLQVQNSFTKLLNTVIISVKLYRKKILFVLDIFKIMMYWKLEFTGRNGTKNKNFIVKSSLFLHVTHLCHYSKSNIQPIWSIKSDRVNLAAPASPVHRARYSTNCDRKGWPGLEIQMYNGCPCVYG